MDGDNQMRVCCCFCGLFLPHADAVQLIASMGGMDGEQQNLFVHKRCLVERLHPSVPLHPDLYDE